MRVLNTGFARIAFNPGPDTMRLTVQHVDGRKVIFCLSPNECCEMINILGDYARDGADEWAADLAMAVLEQERD